MLTLIAALSTVASYASRPGEPLLIVAYVRGSASEIDRYPVGRLSHMNYSFLHLQGNRLALRSSRDSIGISHLVSLKKRNPGLKVILSVGGWGGCKTCSDVFSAREGRHEFAVSAKDLLERFGADGVDLDWEFPAIEGYPGHRFAPEDRHNFTLLVQDLRDVLGSRYEVTFAAGGFMAYLRSSIEWDQVMPLVDRVYLMTYDLVNGFSTSTGHHTPLFSSPGQMESADNAVRYLDSIGVPHSKIVIGAAFYARVWENVDSTNNGLFQKGKFTTFVSYGHLDGYLDSTGAFTKFWDSTAQAPYAYDASKRLFATFDDRRSIALKTNYVLDHRLGGIMFWELTGDKLENGLLDAIVKTAQQAGRQK